MLLITLIIVLRINFKSAKEFTANQSYLTAKNHANTLALSLGAITSDEDLMQTTINAMFDGGYFESITLIREDSSVAYDKREPLVVHGVPSFFMDHVDLAIPVAEAKVMAGWTIYGTLKIKGHPGQSYSKLWQTLKQLCWQFLIVGVAVFFASFLGLRHLLRALDRIKTQAEEISNNEFIIIKEIPNTPELKKVVLAMNTMVGKVKSIFDRHLDTLTRYRELRDKDQVTGLHNRASFIGTLEQFIDSDSPSAQGHVIIIGLAGMEKIERINDRPLLHSIFTTVAAILEKETGSIPDALVARLPRREFAAILPAAGPDQAKQISDTVVYGIMAATANKIPAGIGVYGGLASYYAEDDVGLILSRVDYALSKARAGLTGTVVQFKEEQSPAAIGKQEWKTLFEDAFSQDRFFLTCQPVISDTDMLHREIFINMAAQDAVELQAGLFLPMASALGMAGRLDRHILERASQWLSKHPEDILCVNISTDFCRDRLTGPWLRQFLSDRVELNNQLVFEIHEHTLVRYPEICTDVAGLITGLGFGFGLDRFTINETALQLLEKIKPAYIKIERDYLEVFDDPDKVDMVLNSLFTIVESLSIRLVATKIENETQRLELAGKNIRYFQGHGIAKIAPLKDENE